jgi:hypothetical protein
MCIIECISNNLNKFYNIFLLKDALSMNMNSLSKNPFLQNKLRSQSVSPKRVVKFSYNPSETRERKTKCLLNL